MQGGRGAGAISQGTDLPGVPGGLIRGTVPKLVIHGIRGRRLTFSQFLLSERLARVHQMLRSPLHMARSTSAIAYDAGFGDLSHFNRDFRRRYGATPSDVRAVAKREMGKVIKFALEVSRSARSLFHRPHSHTLIVR